MKKFILFTFLCMITFTGFTQSESYEKEVTMSLGNQNAIVVDMMEISEKDATSYWEDYMKEFTKMKKNRKADEFYAEGANIPLISDKTLDVYSKIEDLKGSSRLYVWIDNGGAFVSSNTDPGATNAAKGFINDFAVQAEKLHVEALIEAEVKNLGKLEKEFKGLEKDKESYEKEIEEAKQKIAKNEKNIEENIVSQENKTTEIDNQKELIEKIKLRLANVGKKTSKM